MRHSALLYALCAHLFAHRTWAEDTESCPRNPFEITCTAPKQKISFQAERWYWKGEKSEAWDGPYDCVEEYCVYVNRNLNGGLVLISAEKNVHVIDKFPVVKTYEHDVPPFYAAQIPGKGIGLIANRTIHKNEIIMQTTPAMLVQFGPHLDFDGETRLELYQRAVQRLPQERRDMFMSQHGVDEFMKVDRNAFRLFINGEQNFSGHLGVYPDVSRFNHDCRPNVHYRMDNITHISIAVQEIAPGEELSISYIDGHLHRKDRLERLSDWGFDCKCAHCTMSEADVKDSDARMDRIYELEEKIEKLVAAGNGVDATLGDELVGLYEAERFWTYIGQAYTRAALLHSLVGNEKETKKYAEKAREAMAREFGPFHKDTIAMAMLEADVKSHWSWRAMKKKLEAKQKVKAGLEAESVSWRMENDTGKEAAMNIPLPEIPPSV